MAPPAHSALVLQGGGALGAYELGAARAFYEDKDFAPGLIAGVSIGAITAALLARPRRGLSPLEALEAFWKKVTVPGLLVPPDLRPYASFLGNPHFFMPRVDFLTWPTWTSFYDTEPLRRTLEELVDLETLAERDAAPGLLVSATDVREGAISYFYSREVSLTLDHIMASGSLPPAFPATEIAGTTFWDGGLFDNTPLGAVLDRLDGGPEAERVVYVVNLFPSKAPLPTNMASIMARMKNLQFANKTAEDLKLLHRINEVAALVAALEQLPGGNPLADEPAYLAIKRRGYIRVPRIVSITSAEIIEEFSDADFSPAGIQKRADAGQAETVKVLGAAAAAAERRKK